MSRPHGQYSPDPPRFRPLRTLERRRTGRFVISKRDPFGTRDPVFEHLERHVDDLFERLLRHPSPSPSQRAWAPRVDVYETHDAYIAVVELAGVDPDGVTIEIEGEAIAISGRRSPAAPPQGAACLQLEIPFGTFERRLVLPSPVDAGVASADFGDGILSVRLPKLRQQPTRVQIDIQRPE